MTVLVDTHVHLYPCFNLPALLEAAALNMQALAPGQNVIRVLCLTERFDCHFYKSLATVKAGELYEGVRIDGQYEGAVRVVCADGSPIYIIAGRQFVTRERLEILALTRDLELEDGRPADEMLKEIQKRDAVPVLSWAPGKWFFERGRVLDSLMKEARPGDLVLGDSSLRPVGWGVPLPMKKARAAGFQVIAGSDPLPFPGEEQQAGSYAARWECEFEEADPAGSIRTLLRSVEHPPVFVGRRGSLLQVLRRLKQNQRVRKH